MKFTKMHGIGNDYVYVNCFTETVENPGEVAKFVSDRHKGIGSDGLILIQPSKIADFEMEMYNADGSRGEMCGNGIRCVGKYVYDAGMTKKKELTIETLGGIKELSLKIENGKVQAVRVNMGTPNFTAKEIPVLSDTEEVVKQNLLVDGNEILVTCVSMGNPHCVVFMEEDIKKVPLEVVGPLFEHHPRFPNRINTEIVNRIDAATLRMRVWERGSGETMACGTGACAVAVAAIRNGLTENKVTVELNGGSLEIEWDQQKACVYMTGTATQVYQGEIQLPDGIK
ncbi:MAG: diaminopimelate epimerase [Lachnospiraceae bacterium]